MIKITDSEYFSLCETKLCDSKYIDYIKSSIVPSERLLDDNLNPVPVPIEHCWALRCYAYALGITYVEEFEAESYEDSIDNYYPGFTMDNIFSSHKMDFVNMLKLIKNDLKKLQISYREIPLDGNISLSNDEYIIKGFISERLQDFHFIRYYPKTNIWFHKMEAEQPCIIQKNDDVEFEKTKYGYEPKYIYRHNGLFRFAYEPVIKLALKEHNN